MLRSSLSLPPELWLHIFQELTIRRFPMKDLDYKLLRCQNPFRICRKIHRSQPWIAHSLLLVCKSWTAAMKPLLYDTIFLWKASQVKALASLLRKLGTSTYSNLDHPNLGSWIKRIIIMISNPNERLASSDIAEMMSSSRNVTALHIVMHLPDESTKREFPNPKTLFPILLLAAPTLQILNLVDCIYNHKEPAISNEFFAKMTALRALRCDRQIIMDKLRPLDYLSVPTYTLRKLKGSDPSIRELFIRDIQSFPLSYSPNEHLRRLNLDITHTIPSRGSSLDDEAEDQADARPEGCSGISNDIEDHAYGLEGEEQGDVDQGSDDPDSHSEGEDVSSPSEVSAASMEAEAIGSDSDSDAGGGLLAFGHFGFGYGGDLQKEVLDLLPPSVTYLSLLCGRWEDLLKRLQRLPATVTSLGLEAGKDHYQDKSYRCLMDVCRDLIAPGLTVVQLNHWQTCVDLRTRHASLLKEFVEMLKNRNVELWDAEGSVMKGTMK